LCIAACFGALLLGRFLPKLGGIFGCRHFFAAAHDDPRTRPPGACDRKNAANFRRKANSGRAKDRKFFLLSLHAIVMLCLMDLFKESPGDDL
jgi:hypothetical protein